jgi:L-asparagine transporter-like permease
MRELRVRLCAVCPRLCVVCLVLVLVFGSLEFFLVLLPVFVFVLLVLLVFGFRRRPTSIGRAFCISRAWRCFGRRLYIRRLCT